MGRDMMRLRRGILLNTPHEEQASGAVASFATDIGKLKECVVEFDPVQDLHGYDSPWPPGGGENKYPTATLTNVTWATTDVALKNTMNSLAEGTYTISFDLVITEVTKTGAWQYGFFCGNPNGNVQRWENVSSDPTVGFTAHFSYTFTLTTNQVGAFTSAYFYGCGSNGQGTMGKATLSNIQIKSGSTATSWSPYSNICPISGWSEVNVYDDPKYDRTVWWNQLFPYKNNAFSGNGFTVKGNNDGSFTITVTADTASESTAHNITSLSAGTMTLGHIYAWVGSKNGISIVIKNQTRYTDQIFTCTNAGYTNITFVFTDLPQGTYNIYPMLCDLTEMFGVGNEPSTVADFKALFPHDYYAYNAGEETLVSAVNGEPYRAVTIDLDGTRYGGTVDVVSGTMRVDRAKTMYTSELSISNWYSHDADYDTWGFYSNYDYRWQTVIGLLPVGDLIADKMPTVSSSYGTDRLNCSLILHQTGANAGTMQYMAFRIPKSLLPTPTDSANLTTLVKAWLDENPIEISFKIAPFTVQLTPAQLHAIKGQNNIFSDCGDVAVKYWKH